MNTDNDLLSIVKRAIDEISTTTRNSTAPFNASPLQHGDDSRLAADAFLARAEGNRRLALKLVRDDIQRRYPNFKAVRGFPGYREWARVVRMIYTICPTVKKQVTA